MPKSADPADAEIREDFSAREMGASRLALIHAAERLFAEHGIAGVSLRQVNQAAGNKNMAAAHYHFGSREGLVRAVLEHRMSAIDRRRAELLSRAATLGREHDLRLYVEAYVIPLAEQLSRRPEGNHYLRFLLQHNSVPVDRETLEKFTPSAFIMSGRMNDLLSYLPNEIVRVRQNTSMSMIIGALAAAELELSRGDLDHRGVALIVANLIDTTTAAMTAPISGDTLQILRG